MSVRWVEKTKRAKPLAPLPSQGQKTLLFSAMYSSAITLNASAITSFRVMACPAAHAARLLPSN
jgi:hypothetical protein